MERRNVTVMEWRNVAVGFTKDQKAKTLFESNLQIFSKSGIDFGFAVDDSELVCETRYHTKLCFVFWVFQRC